MEDKNVSEFRCCPESQIFVYYVPVRRFCEQRPDKVEAHFLNKAKKIYVPCPAHKMRLLQAVYKLVRLWTTPEFIFRLVKLKRARNQLGLLFIPYTSLIFLDQTSSLEESFQFSCNI